MLVVGSFVRKMIYIGFCKVDNACADDPSVGDGSSARGATDGSSCMAPPSLLWKDFSTATPVFTPSSFWLVLKNLVA